MLPLEDDPESLLELLELLELLTFCPLVPFWFGMEDTNCSTTIKSLIQKKELTSLQYVLRQAVKVEQTYLTLHQGFFTNIRFLSLQTKEIVTFSTNVRFFLQ
jgi:hypothetical protein